ncbi:ESAT-6-like protein [Oceanobacillus sp. J11TS1]|nr:ESAT-6-like protein [Oceanobacillus sp. J11TS1]
MMAGQIRMSPEELQAKAKRYGQGSEQIDQVLTNLSNLQDELRGEWEGRAFDQFEVQFRQLEPKVKEFSQLLLDIQDQLTKTAEAVAQQDEALSRNFGLS